MNVSFLYKIPSYGLLSLRPSVYAAEPVKIDPQHLRKPQQLIVGNKALTLFDAADDLLPDDDVYELEFYFILFLN